MANGRSISIQTTSTSNDQDSPMEVTFKHADDARRFQRELDLLVINGGNTRITVGSNKLNVGSSELPVDTYGNGTSTVDLGFEPLARLASVVRVFNDKSLFDLKIKDASRHLKMIVHTDRQLLVWHDPALN